MRKPIETIDDLTPDNRNANAGSQRASALLERSLRQLGAGRSILTDRHGNVLAGNKTLQAAVDAGIPIQTVTSDGSRLIVVVRDDLDITGSPADERRARDLALADNRIGEVSLTWDVAELASLAQDGAITPSDLWTDDEWAGLMNQAATETTGMDEDQTETCECCGQPIR